MKNLLMIITVSVFSLSILSFSVSNESTVITKQDGDNSFQIPSDVQEIVDKSCYGCHNSESSSTKGKMKLNFDDLSGMKAGKLVGKLGKISKTVLNGKMPKESFIEKYPERALTKEETDRLTSWADETAQSYGGY